MLTYSSPPFPPPAVTVADTKDRFIKAYPFPIPSVWSVAVQELLVDGESGPFETAFDGHAVRMDQLDRHDIVDPG